MESFANAAVLASDGKSCGRAAEFLDQVREAHGRATYWSSGAKSRARREVAGTKAQTGRLNLDGSSVARRA
jgi:hypothetical protein